MTEIEFRPWPKIARWNREIVITEKIDGANGAIGIVELVPFDDSVDWNDGSGVTTVNDKTYRIYAQSRNRIVTLEDNHFGFSQWVNENRKALVETLGEGLHFGEWWGSKIGRGYGLTNGERRFSLFNTSRWNAENTSSVPGLGAVPVLYEGKMDAREIRHSTARLNLHGSSAAPGFDRPEGIVIFHTASNHLYKITLENDASPKSATK